MIELKHSITFVETHISSTQAENRHLSQHCPTYWFSCWKYIPSTIIYPNYFVIQVILNGKLNIIEVACVAGSDEVSPLWGTEQWAFSIPMIGNDLSETERVRLSTAAVNRFEPWFLSCPCRAPAWTLLWSYRQNSQQRIGGGELEVTPPLRFFSFFCFCFSPGPEVGLRLQ